MILLLSQPPVYDAGMSIVSAFGDGAGRVGRAPALVFGLWLAYVLWPVPIAMDFSEVDLGLLEASAIDPVPALVILLRDRDMAMHGLLTTFLLGGLIDRLARDRSVATFGFSGACGMFFFRFLRLDIIAAAAYLAVFLLIYQASLEFRSVGMALGALVVVLNVIFDFARVRLVVEDRRSAIGAIAASFRFVRRNAAAAAIIVAVNVGIAALAWWLAASATIGVTIGVYGYLLARAVLRLLFIASATSLFQSRLAHARYVARPVATWPDPAASFSAPR